MLRPLPHTIFEGIFMQEISKRNTTFILALVPLVLALFVSCSSAPEKVELTPETTQHWNATVEKTIAEPERAAKLKQLGQQLIDVSSSIQQDIEALNQQAMALHENYDATHEELQQLIGKFSEKRNPKFAEYRDIIFAMRKQVSAEEWKALTD
jgi:FtsZ-binding cell division protein ZapB